MTISVLTATYNAAAQLPRLIESLRSQTDRNFEWIVVDGASTDGTVDLIRSAGDLVIHWISEPDFGIYHALNKGLALAQGDYYLVVGSDDVLDPGAIERYQQAADATRADIISAPVWADGRLMVPRRTLSCLRSGPPLVSGHSVGALIRKDLHRELGAYSRQYPIAADTLFLLRALRAGKRFSYIDQPAGTFGTGGASGTDVLGALSESFRANVEIHGLWPLHFAFFTLRVLKNSRRIGRQQMRMAEKNDR